MSEEYEVVDLEQEDYEDEEDSVVEVNETSKAVVRQAIRQAHATVPDDLLGESLSYVCGKEVTDEDFVGLLDRYAKDPDVTLYTLAVVLGYHYSAVIAKANSPRFKGIYTNCKRMRSEMLMQTGRSILHDTYDRVMSGEKVTQAEVKIAAECAKYDMVYAQKIDPDSSKTSLQGDVNTQINIITGVENNR